MVIKKFEAPTLERALTEVKDAMGENALILSTQKKLGIVEVTVTDEWPHRELPQCMAKETFMRNRHWAAVGIAGSGKTSFLVKLALHLKMEEKKPVLISSDHRKVLGKQELATYARLIEVPFFSQVPDRAMLNDDWITLTDTPAIVPDPSERKKMERICEHKSVVIVLDASMRRQGLLQVVRETASLRPSAIAFTRFDRVTEHGILRELLEAAQLPFLGASVSQSFAERLLLNHSDVAAQGGEHAIIKPSHIGRMTSSLTAGRTTVR